MELWNVKNLKYPPITTYKVKKRDVDIHTLYEIFMEALHTFKNQDKLEEEAALLSRCIYRMKLKFRSDKGLKAMEKVNRALLQYRRMNFPQALETFHGMIPKKYTLDTYLPTLNMLHYLLIRIQGLSKLMIRIVDSAEIAGEFMEYRISLGHLWKVALVCFGVVSRIFVLAKELAKYCCKIYSQLFPFTTTLGNTGFNWLPSECCLPKDLKSWLNVDWLDKEPVLLEMPKILKVPSIFDIVDSDSDIEICGEYTEIQDDVEITNEYVEVKEGKGNQNFTTEKNKPHTLPQSHTVVVKKDTETGTRVGDSVIPFISLESCKPNMLEEEEDLGEVVRPTDTSNVCSKSRSSRNKKKNKVKNLEMSKDAKDENVRSLITNITTLKDLKTFEKNFENIQKQHSNIFNRMDKLQSNMLRSEVKKWINKAKKHHAEHSKVNLCICKAKEALKSRLI